MSCGHEQSDTTDTSLFIFRTTYTSLYLDLELLVAHTRKPTQVTILARVVAGEP